VRPARVDRELPRINPDKARNIIIAILLRPSAEEFTVMMQTYMNFWFFISICYLVGRFKEHVGDKHSLWPGVIVSAIVLMATVALEFIKTGRFFT
jgi:hypothetical protein